MIESMSRVSNRMGAADHTEGKLATMAVFRSWNGKRAFDYRKAANIPHDLGTAVNVVTLVFGNLGADSGTGVATTKPSSRERCPAAVSSATSAHMRFGPATQVASVASTKALRGWFSVGRSCWSKSSPSA